VKIDEQPLARSIYARILRLALNSFSFMAFDWCTAAASAA
jgi:hypothetical protein